jgi:subtilisin
MTRTTRPARASPWHTGRHLVLFKEDGGIEQARKLRNLAGLRIAASTDRDTAISQEDLAPGEGVLFERLGAALLNGDPDQAKAITGSANKTLLLVEPERYVRATASRSEVRSSHALLMLPLSDTRGAAWGLHAVGALRSRYSGRGSRVAILDSGFDTRHHDFGGRNVVAKSFVPRLSVEDSNGHGTRCVGVACGPRTPRKGPRYGVAYGADIYVAKVLDDDANGVDGHVIAGIDWALRMKCAVISISLGSPVISGDSYSRVYERVASRALAAGSLLIAPAGNASQRPNLIAAVEHPANCPSMFAVGAVDQNLRLAPFSNGAHAAGERDVDVVAPGIDIKCPSLQAEGLDMANGTSIAAPFVAGVAALLCETSPDARGAALRTLLLSTCRTLSDRQARAGLVQAPG